MPEEKIEKPVHFIAVFIYLDGITPVPCGILRAENNASQSKTSRTEAASFRYGQLYLERPDAVPLDPVALPLSEELRGQTFLTPAGIPLHGCFRDSAPDQWGSYLLMRAAGRELSPLELLLATSDLRVGDLAYATDFSTGPLPARPWANGQNNLAKMDLAQMQEAAEGMEADAPWQEFFRNFIDPGSSLGGSRPKATVQWKNSLWIAKFAAKRDPFNNARVEFANMNLAKECGLEVPALDITSINGQDIFLIKRFDRRKQLRVGFLSGLTALGAVNLTDSVTGGIGYSDLGDWLKRYGDNSNSDRLELFKRIAFNILCNNTDDRLRNHAFLRTGNKYLLSPLYDVLPSREIGRHRKLLMTVGASGRDATLKNLLSHAQRFGLADDDARTILLKMQKICTGWSHFYQRKGVSKVDIEYFASADTFLAVDETF